MFILLFHYFIQRGRAHFSSDALTYIVARKREFTPVESAFLWENGPDGC